METHKYTEIEEKVQDLYVEGLSKKKIANALKVDINQVGYILYIKLKVHMRYPRKKVNTGLLDLLPREKVNRIITLVNFGYNLKEIANDQALDSREVYKLVREAKQKNLINKVA
jgi:DNA-binding CsgD family transcriptional regulator